MTFSSSCSTSSSSWIAGNAKTAFSTSLSHLSINSFGSLAQAIGLLLSKRTDDARWLLCSLLTFDELEALPYLCGALLRFFFRLSRLSMTESDD
jgi:hypothetical protein